MISISLPVLRLLLSTFCKRDVHKYCLFVYLFAENNLRKEHTEVDTMPTNAADVSNSV